MNTIDKRIQKTRKRLKDALISLVIEQGYEGITIQDVTKKAEVGYRTFFRHYGGLDDLLLSILKEQLVEMRDRMVDPNTHLAPEYNGRLLFDYVLENRDLFLVMVRSNFIHDMLPDLQEDVLNTFSGIFPLQTQGISDLVVHHIITSILSLITWWLENDLPHPPEKMGRIYAQLIMYPSRMLLESGVSGSTGEI